MNIIVCLKQVPIILSDFRLNESGELGPNTTYDINEADDYALEAAIQLKQRVGGTVTAVTMGPDRAKDVLYLALAKGADSAVHINDRGLDGSDNLVTAKVLARAARLIGFDLVLAGVQETDDLHMYVGVAMAEMLNIPSVSVVTKIEPSGQALRVTKELGSGMLEVVEVGLPSLLTVQFGIHQLRYASVTSRLMARKKPIRNLTINDLGLRPEEVGRLGAKLNQTKFSPIRSQKNARIIAGTPKEAAAELVRLLKTEAKVIK